MATTGTTGAPATERLDPRRGPLPLHELGLRSPLSHLEAAGASHGSDEGFLGE